MGVNVVVYSGRTLIDLSNDTVTPETLPEGVTAHNAAGEAIVGTMKITESQATQATLAASGWTASGGRYYQSAAASFVTADSPVVNVSVYSGGTDPDTYDAMKAAFGQIYRAVQGAGSITFWAKAMPEADITLNIGVS